MNEQNASKTETSSFFAARDLYLESHSRPENVIWLVLNIMTALLNLTNEIQ